MSKPLSKWDWVVLPGLSVLTMAVIVAAAQFAAHALLAESKTSTLKCLIINDPSTGVRAIPNTACTQKIPESALTTYAINSCGHRAGVECQPKAADSYRIVMVGSSFNYGMWVPREASFAALLPGELSQRTGRKVELYNEAMQWGMPRSVMLRFKEVLTAQPDLVLWPLTPQDFDKVDTVTPWMAPTATDLAKDPHSGVWYRLTTALTSKSPAEFVSDAWQRLVVKKLNDSQAVLLLQHFIFQSQSQFVKQYLMQPEDSDYLRKQHSAEFQAKFAHFERYFEDVQARAAAAGAPVVVVLLPERAQAAMISMKQWPDDVDPYLLGREIREFVTSHGGLYVDVLPDFETVPNPEQQYMPVDGHPTVAGHALMTGMLSQALTSGVIPALKANN